MAEKIPTPISPEDLLSSKRSKASTMADSDSDSTSDIVEESAEQLFNRLLDEHEREFKLKLRALTGQAKILAEDHGKSMKQLKNALKQYMGKKPDVVRFAENPDTKWQPSTQPSEPAVEDEALIPAKPSTTAGSHDLLAEALELERLARAAREMSQSTKKPQAPTEQPDQHSRLADVDQLNQEPASSSREPDGRVPTRSRAWPSSVARESAPPYNEGEGLEDINHEDSSHEHDVPMEDAPQQVDPPINKSTNTPKTNGTATQAPPLSGRSAPKKKWDDVEEDRMIDIIYHLTQETEEDALKGDMWRRAEAMHRSSGYSRSWEQMAAKWSVQSRHKCAERGLAWAKDVMKKNPHVSRKRRALSPGGPQSQNDSPINFKIKRARKKSSKSRDAEAVHVPLVRKPSQPLGRKSELQLRYTFTGASADLVQVDWSPDGKYFAAASGSIVNEDRNFVDNRPRNLLYGSLSTKTIRELPEHRIERESGEPRYVYKTVSAVKFSKDGRRMYTGGYDNKLRVWNVENELELECKAELQYKHRRIEVMDVTGDRTTIVATGTSSGTRSIRVFIGDADLGAADCDEIRPLQKMGIDTFAYAPTCLKFGKGQSHNRLLAGFGEDVDDAEGPFGDGCMGVWQFTESDCVPMEFDQVSTFVSDCTWSPDGDLFVVGVVSDPANQRVKGEHSVVKLYSIRDRKPTTSFSCRARDINDVSYNYGQVTASCTDGSTYIWDHRNPRTPLHTLTHGEPVGNYGNGFDRELNDVGVRFVEWTENPGRLYTGGSDGLLKLWDTRLSQADVLVQDIADIGHEILCGKFSPDHSTLLIGDEDGRLHIFDKSKKQLPKDDYKFMVAERWAGH